MSVSLQSLTEHKARGLASRKTPSKVYGTLRYCLYGTVYVRCARKNKSFARVHPAPETITPDLNARMDITQRMTSTDYLHAGVPKRTTEAEEIAELQALGINHPARRRWREKEQAKKWEQREKSWNSTPLRYRPAELRGLKPATPEPWAIDEEFYQKKTGSLEYEYNSRGPYREKSPGEYYLWGLQ